MMYISSCPGFLPLPPRNNTRSCTSTGIDLKTICLQVYTSIQVGRCNSAGINCKVVWRCRVSKYRATTIYTQYYCNCIESLSSKKKQALAGQPKHISTLSLLKDLPYLFTYGWRNICSFCL